MAEIVKPPQKENNEAKEQVCDVCDDDENVHAVRSPNLRMVLATAKTTRRRSRCSEHGSSIDAIIASHIRLVFAQLFFAHR
jgi:hypothetical protein